MKDAPKRNGVLDRVVRVVLRVAYRALHAYWFIVRPRTRGVKVVLERDGRILLVRHSYGYPGWSFPGGGVRKGEALDAAAIREVREELGIRLTEVDLLGSFVSTVEHKKDQVTVYLARTTQEPRIDGREIVASVWDGPKSLLPLTPVGERILHLYLRSVSDAAGDRTF